MGGGNLAVVVAAVTATLLLLPGFTGVAGAQGYEETTRRQWVREADNVCEKPYKRGNRLVDRFAKRVDRERWGPAGEILIRLSKLVRGVVDRVAELDRPPADAAEIERWLDAEERGAELFKRAGQQLRRDKVRRAAKLLDRSDRIVTRGQKAVKDFGLRKCV